MLKSDILTQCGLRIGDTDPTFLSQTLSPTLDYVFLELAQDECLSLLRKQTPFVFNAAGCVASNGLLNVNTATVLGLTAGEYPERVNRLNVPAWGYPWGRLLKKPDEAFERLWLAYQPTYLARPLIWRLFPNMSQLQIWPAPDSDSATATCLLEWLDSPTKLLDSDNILEVSAADIPTLVAGLYTYGLKFQDQTIADTQNAMALWLAGKQAMRARITRQHYLGRKVQIQYQDL